MARAPPGRPGDPRAPLRGLSAMIGRMDDDSPPGGPTRWVRLERRKLPGAMSPHRATEFVQLGNGPKGPPQPPEPAPLRVQPAVPRRGLRPADPGRPFVGFRRGPATARLRLQHNRRQRWVLLLGLGLGLLLGLAASGLLLLVLAG